MNTSTRKIVFVLLFAFCFFTGLLKADDTVYPTAILEFKAKGVNQEDTDKIPLLLMAKLTTFNNLVLVEREELLKVLTEQEINKSGLVDEAAMIKVGKFVGAKLIITGSHFKVEKSNYIVAKIISTETTKVLGISVNGEKELGQLVNELAQKINEEITKKASNIIAKSITRDDIVKDIMSKYDGKKRPSVTIKIKEESLLSTKIDPAAETELCFIYEKIGGKILNKTTEGNEPDYIITGEGFCEFATKVGKLFCVKSRLEIKVVNKSGDIIASERVVTWEVDTAENIAAKASLEKSGDLIASIVFAKLIEKFN